MKLQAECDNRRVVRLSVRRALLAAAAAVAATPATFAAAPAADNELEEVVVTGSILKRTDAETASPVSVISAEVLEERGITTTAEALQRLPGNNAGTMQSGWNAGGNFAAGATAPALRGLTVQSTLSVADGLRLPQYPYADDGHRGFVDLNMIPSAIVDRIEVLRDGASSTYGTDAIAGVINVITKKEIQGLHFDGSYGVSQRNDSDEKRISITAGKGDLAADGYNVYISGEFQKQAALYARDRGYPYNTLDYQQICSDDGSTCMRNTNWNGVTTEQFLANPATGFNGLFSIPGVALVRPVTTAGATSGSGRFQFLNPAAGCREWKTITIAATQSATSPLTTCEVNQQAAYRMLQPELQRMGLTMRGTVNLTDNMQAYAMATFYKNDSYTISPPRGFNENVAQPRPAGLPAYNVILPVYVCPTGVGTLNGLNTGCTSTNGTLNPNNPFAGAGQTAQVSLRNPNPLTSRPKVSTYRAAAGVEGSFGDGWNYQADFTASKIDLTETRTGYLIPQRIMDVVARGQFNFSNPYATPQSVWDAISPTSVKSSTSNLWQVQGTLAKDLWTLPGGIMKAAIGASYRQEAVSAPSGNPQNDLEPYSRYAVLNAVGAVGSRWVRSAYFETDAPVLEQVDLTAAGRYDDYSSGQNHFSPKLGIKYKPFEQLALRSTWSQGFRVPSFNEAFGLPTTGFVTSVIPCSNATYTAFCTAHGGTGNSYVGNSYSIGLTNSGNPSLKPEKSNSYTAGLIWEPMKNVSFTVDYWNIKIKGLIKGVTADSAIIAQWYATNGNANIPGIVLIPDTVDQAFPNALPRLGFIQASFQNLDWQKASGLDFGATVSMPIASTGVTWRSAFDASYMINLSEVISGTVNHYDGTLSPCDVTSCSGAPSWRATWQNSFEYGKTTTSLTAYWTKGYDNASVDYGGVKGDCENNVGASVQTFANGDPQACHSPDVWNVDLTMRYKATDKVTIYGDVLNVLDLKAKFDPASTYQIFGFNPSWSSPNIMGRYFRIGAKLDL